MRHWTRRGFGSALAGGLLAPAGLAQSVRPVKFITSLPTLTVAVPFTMLAKGLDRAHGIAVEMRYAGGSSSLMIDAVLSGDAAFGSPGTLTAVQAIRQGADLRIIGAISNNQLATVISNAAMQRVGVSPSAAIGERIRALKGLTIGTNPVGSTYYQVFRFYSQAPLRLNPDRMCGSSRLRSRAR